MTNNNRYISTSDNRLARLWVPYRHGRIDLQGYLVYDAQRTAPLPGVLVYHEYTGPGPQVYAVAERLAQDGFAAMAVDMYGHESHPRDREAADRLCRIFRNDRSLMRERAMAAVDTLAASERVDAHRMFALGYSFGGGTVLELARAGANLVGVVSVYGYLQSPLAATPGSVRARILALHAGRDRVVPQEEIDAFVTEMRKAGADCEVRIYEEAEHGFANPEASAGNRASTYCAETARRSYDEALSFFRETEKGTLAP